MVKNLVNDYKDLCSQVFIRPGIINAFRYRSFRPGIISVFRYRPFFGAIIILFSQPANPPEAQETKARMRYAPFLSCGKIKTKPESLENIIKI
jgi:hypothetical protein